MNDPRSRARRDELTRLVEAVGERQEVLRHIASEGGVLLGCSRREGPSRMKVQMRANPDDPRHGTATGYRYGCRCDACKEADRLYRKKRKGNR